MRLLLTVIGFLCMAPAAFADCGRENLIDGLNADRRNTLMQMVAAHPNPNGNLWRARRGTSTIHVIGTFHLFDPRMPDIVAGLAQLIETADRLFVEATEEDVTELQKILTERPELAFIQSGPTLVELLDEQEWELLSSLLSAHGIPGFFAAKMRPWYASVLLAVPPCAAGALTTASGLDSMLMEIADIANIPTERLEDPMTAVNIFGNEPMDVQLEILRSALFMQGDADAQFTTMRESYFAGNHREIWEFNRMIAQELAAEQDFDFDAVFETFEARLLTDRNVAWMDVLLPGAVDSHVVVAVGAAHLSGELGVLNLLEEAGYTLEQLDD